MSSSTLLLVPVDGPMIELCEYQNSHGSAPRVWNALAKSYIGVHWMACGDALWKLVYDSRLQECERVALAWTFDHTICNMCGRHSLAMLLRRFDKLHPAATGAANHLPAVAESLSSYADERSIEADIGFAFIHTSVSDDVWDVQDTCSHAFHDDGDPDECCPECGNEKDDRRTWRRFDWSKDKGKGIHEMIARYFGLKPPDKRSE
jgi:hypothetical protein